MNLSKVITTFFGIGYIGKGAGSIAALWVCVLLYYSVSLTIHITILLPLLSILIFVAGVASSAQVEKSWGKDHQRVVIDEVFGMIVTMLFLPINLLSLALGFILFRFFDILKPLFIRRLESMKGGWGVMMDDLLAGVYANIMLRIIIYSISNYYETLL